MGGTAIQVGVGPDADHDPTKYIGQVDVAIRAIAHPVRRAMLSALSNGSEMSASQLGKALGLDGSRLQDARYQVRYLAKSGWIEQTRVVPPKRGSTPMRMYRIKRDYLALLASIAELEERVECEASPVEVTLPTRISRVPLRASAACSCRSSLPDGNGCCVNCSKPAGAAMA